MRRGNALHASAFFHKVLVLRVTCIVQEHVFPYFFNYFSVNSSAIPYCPPGKPVSRTQMSTARRDLVWYAASARLLFDGDDAVLHNTVRTPSRRGHRSLPAAAARFLCGRNLTPAIITDIKLSRMTLGKCRLPLCHFRDVILTPAGITDITLSRMTLGKCRLPLLHFRDVTLTPQESRI